MTHDAHPTRAEMDRLIDEIFERDARLGAALADDAGNLPRLARSAHQSAIEELDEEDPDWTLLRSLHRLWKLAEGAA